MFVLVIAWKVEDVREKQSVHVEREKCMYFLLCFCFDASRVNGFENIEQRIEEKEGSRVKVVVHLRM